MIPSEWITKHPKDASGQMRAGHKAHNNSSCLESNELWVGATIITSPTIAWHQIISLIYKPLIKEDGLNYILDKFYFETVDFSKDT